MCWCCFLIVLNIGGIDIGGDGVVPFFFNPFGVHIKLLTIAHKGWVLNDVFVEWDGSRHALNDVLCEGAACPLQGLVTGFAEDDELCQHGVKLSANDGAFYNAGVHANARTRRLDVLGDFAGGGHEVVACVFAVDAELKCMAARGGVFFNMKFLALGDAELFAH